MFFGREKMVLSIFVYFPRCRNKNGRFSLVDYEWVCNERERNQCEKNEHSRENERKTKKQIEENYLTTMQWAKDEMLMVFVAVRWWWWWRCCCWCCFDTDSLNMSHSSTNLLQKIDSFVRKFIIVLPCQTFFPIFIW